MHDQQFQAIQQELYRLLIQLQMFKHFLKHSDYPETDKFLFVASTRLIKLIDATIGEINPQSYAQAIFGLEIAIEVLVGHHQVLFARQLTSNVDKGNFITVKKLLAQLRSIVKQIKTENKRHEKV